MDYKELKEKTAVELQKLLKVNREKVRDLRFKIANKQLKNLKEVAKAKKIVARILTLVNQKGKDKQEVPNKE